MGCTTRVHRMAKVGDTSGLAQMLAKLPGLLEVEDSRGHTPLHNAALSDHADAVELLLGLGADPDGGVSQGPNTPLLPVVVARHTDVARLLLDARPLLDVPGHFTPLCAAAANGDMTLVRMLVDAGADVNANAFDERTEEGQVLRFVALHGTLTHEIANLERYGTTMFGPPLHWAAYGGHRDVARMLLDQGARRDARGRHNLTAADWAAAQGHSELSGLLAPKAGD
jgi:ankyrin repeat protein